MYDCTANTIAIRALRTFCAATAKCSDAAHITDAVETVTETGRGRVIIAGRFVPSDGIFNDIGVVALTSTGDLDTTFGSPTIDDSVLALIANAQRLVTPGPVFPNHHVVVTRHVMHVDTGEVSTFDMPLGPSPNSITLSNGAIYLTGRLNDDQPYPSAWIDEPRIYRLHPNDQAPTPPE